MIGRDPDDDLPIHIAVSLLEMLPDEPATLEFVRQRILGYGEDEPIEALDLLLATVATMAGWDFPEHAEWRALAIAEEERMRSFEDGDPSRDESVRTAMLAGVPHQEAAREAFDSELDDLGALEDQRDDATPSVPFIRETPKIGRNDPCPCKSGKKYKKCCGKAD